MKNLRLASTVLTIRGGSAFLKAMGFLVDVLAFEVHPPPTRQHSTATSAKEHPPPSLLPPSVSLSLSLSAAAAAAVEVPWGAAVMTCLRWIDQWVGLAVQS